MPQFLTISPTHIKGKKEFAWNNFLKGAYIAIGWGHTDYTMMADLDMIRHIKSVGYENEGEAIDAFRKMKKLRVGDIVAVNNVNYGLFGIGRVDLGFKFSKGIHNPGTENPENYYSHYRKVKWLVKKYHKADEILIEGEVAWKPKGTVGKLHEQTPQYILRLLDRFIGINEDEFQLCKTVRSCIQHYLEKNEISRAEVKDVIPTLKSSKLFNQSSTFRDFLRRLHTLDILHLIPQARYRDEPSSKRWWFEPVPISDRDPNLEDVELIGYEGKVREELRIHKSIERDKKFVQNYKQKYQHVRFCEACEFDPSTKYKLQHYEFLELHHLKPLSLRKGSKNTITKEEDVVLLCPNCHHAIHRYMIDNELPTVSLNDFKQSFKL